MAKKIQVRKVCPVCRTNQRMVCLAAVEGEIKGLRRAALKSEHNGWPWYKIADWCRAEAKRLKGGGR